MIDDNDKSGKSELNGDNVLWLGVRAGSLNAVAKRPITFFIPTLGNFFDIFLF